MDTTVSVSLTPTVASGALCSSSPIAAAFTVVNTEAEALALAGVLHGKRTVESSSSWVPELYEHEMSSPPAFTKMENEGTGQATADTRPLNITANESSLTSSGQLGAPFSVGALQNQQHRMPLLRSSPSVELPGTIGSAVNSSVPVLMDASGVSAAVTSAAASNVAPSYRLSKKVSWKCKLCGYYVLAMDQEGTPLPFTTSAFGNVIPLTCPRCAVSHTSWQSSSPFNKEGDHKNLPTTLSNRYFMLTAGEQPMRLKDKEATGPTGHLNASAEAAPSLVVGNRLDQVAVPVSLLATKQRGALRTPAVPSVQRRAFYCGRCGRRLLRVDANGELVDMDRDQEGEVLPITCPGCKENHNDWVVKPYAVHR
ncbi:hypothetical protein JKF63_06918 [Porcisia hertigi]|uniref:Uncharacterized protein n=1 Tax=Porcisia hertigi TaxID=2761500 RepID=A0A836LJC6_9TRYP|nr:hypothetical protein JKF63_06918 [Porcisia hertigi]